MGDFVLRLRETHLILRFPLRAHSFDVYGGTIMAKRRNLKKDKAARNAAYARQFRKKSTRSYSKGRRYSSGGSDSETNEQSNNTEE